MTTYYPGEQGPDLTEQPQERLLLMQVQNLSVNDAVNIVLKEPVALHGTLSRPMTALEKVLATKLGLIVGPGVTVLMAYPADVTAQEAVLRFNGIVVNVGQNAMSMLNSARSLVVQLNDSIAAGNHDINPTR